MLASFWDGRRAAVLANAMKISMLQINLEFSALFFQAKPMYNLKYTSDRVSHMVLRNSKKKCH
jgi:hypothetical protein